MKLRFLTTALAALVGVLLTQPASAQYTASPEDMILSFYEAGYPNDLQIDLGPITQFIGSNPTFTSINIDTDLVDQYGANWYASSTLDWSVVGANSSGATDNGFLNKSIFVTTPTFAALPAETGNALAPQATRIALLYSSYGGAATAGNAADSTIVPINTTNSYFNDRAGGNFGTANSVENNFASGTPSYLYLDVLQPNANNNLAGTSVLEPYQFGITDSGIFFLNTPVPEPSTYALMLVGAFLLAFQIYRRKKRGRA